MFTGIVEEIGKVAGIRKGVHSIVLTIRASKVLEHTKIGDSIAVNGICLTVTSIGGKMFTADVMHETLNRSSLKQIQVGTPVNLERAMAADGRFGGHMVAGHVDGVGTITQIEQDDNAYRYTIQADASLLHYMIEKGSITIDGISLTIVAVHANDFQVSVIPHTTAQTILQYRKKGDVVNLENDLVGKYIEKFLMDRVDNRSVGKAQSSSQSTLDMGMLARTGFLD